MNKLFICLALFGLITTALSAANCDNPLLAEFGFKGLDAPEVVENLKYCKSIKDGESCCGVDVVNEIQTNVDDLAKKLSVVVAKRDKAIVEMRDKVIPGMKKGLEDLKEKSDKAVKAIKAPKPPKAEDPPEGPPEGGEEPPKDGEEPPKDGEEPEGGEPPKPPGEKPPRPPRAYTSDQAAQVAGNLQQVAEKCMDKLPDIKNDFNDFQRSRSSCVIELLQLQSAAWCLACDPNWEEKGVVVVDEVLSITLSDRVCKRLQSSCYKFITKSAGQSAILSVKTISSMIDQVAASMEKLANDDETGLDDLADAVNGNTENVPADDTPDENAGQPVRVPDECTKDDDCDWICDNMFKAGKIEETNIVVGGQIADPTEADEEVESRLLGKKKRVLADSEWNPDQDEAGVTVSWEDDPAGVKNDETVALGAGVVKSGLVCVAALVVFFL